MVGEATARKDDADWVSVSDLASERGVSHQAISKRVRALSMRGKLPTRREGKTVLIHRPSFEALAAARHDPAQDLRNRHTKAPTIADEQNAMGIVASAVDAKIALDGAYNGAAAREKNAKADLAEMELARKRGELVPARDLEEAAVVVGTAIVQRVAALKALSGQLYAASKGGEDALRILLVEKVAEILRAISDDMQKLAIGGKPEKEPAPPN